MNIKNTIKVPTYWWRPAFLALFVLAATLQVQSQVNHPTSGTINQTVNCGTPINYYDSGGAGANYFFFESGTVIFCPDVAGTPITIEFGVVDIETSNGSGIFAGGCCWDALTISDANGNLFEGCGEDSGDGSDACNIEGGTNDLNPGDVFTSTAPNGCLTVSFNSDGNVNETGWEATVTCAGGGPTCDIMITGATPTAESCSGAGDGGLVVTANSSNPPIAYAISGPVNASNGTGVFNNLPPGVYNITVTDAIGGTCEATSTVTVPAGTGTCPTISRTNANDPTSFDPCSCGDPQNYYDGNGDITYFHDFVEVTSVTGETWEVTAVSAQAYSDDGTTNILVGDVLTETAPGSGIYRIDLFHPPGVGFTMTVDRTAGGGPFPLMEGGTCAACQQVPTLGQWGLILLSLLILTFGVVALRRHEPVLAMAGQGGSTASSNRSLPFNKAAFGKMLIVVMVGLAAVFAVAIAFFGYEMTAADVPGSLVCGPLLAYLLHLLAKRD